MTQRDTVGLAILLTLLGTLIAGLWYTTVRPRPGTEPKRIEDSVLVDQMYKTQQHVKDK